MKSRIRLCSFLISSVVLFASQQSMATSAQGGDGEVVTDRNEPGITSEQLVQSILGDDVEILNVRHTGTPRQAGFVSGLAIPGLPSEAVILGTGNILDVIGPNVSDATSSKESKPESEDADFMDLNDGHRTRDTSIIELEFVPQEGQGQIIIEYAFGSDEYDLDSSKLADRRHDFMAIFVNGVNCAIVPSSAGGGQKVGVSSINNQVNSTLYVDNIRTESLYSSEPLSQYITEMDGFSKMLTCIAPVRGGKINHLKLGIADAYQGFRRVDIDSWVLFKAVYTDRFLDNDGDGWRNHIDPDDDNDLIPDDVERNFDVDGDGIPNRFDTDSDGDGIDDRTECLYSHGCQDSDGDGIPDFLDADGTGAGSGDSDGDGLSDAKECPAGQVDANIAATGDRCSDNDGDSIPDYADSDSNNDGVDDGEDCGNSFAPCLDTDGDGTPDHLDFDQDNDGIPNSDDGSFDVDGDQKLNRLDTDSDGDGVSDTQECAGIRGCEDSDEDGIADFLDADSDSADSGDSDNDGLSDALECPAPGEYGEACVDTDGDLIPDYSDGNGVTRDIEEPVETPAGGNVSVGSSGSGALNPVMLGLLLLSVIWRVTTGLKRRLPRFFFSATLGFVLLGLMPAGQSGQAFAKDSSSKSSANGFYAGLGVGLSSFDPDVSGSSYVLEEDRGAGQKIFAGFDVFDALSFEVAIADLGEAEFSPDGYIEYQPLSLTGAFHILGQRERSVYIKAGLATLNTSSDLAVDIESSTQLLVGIGAELAFGGGWSLRGEIESYDENARHLTVGLVKRFGRRSSKGFVNKWFVSGSSVVCFDAQQDDCILPPLSEQRESCSAISGVVEGIRFELNGAELTPDAKIVLGESADVLKRCPSYKVQIQAYTDNIGSREHNLVLSGHRAHAVRTYFVERGIALSRLESRGYGESNPAASNETKAGRAMNRRVELRLADFGARSFITSDE